MRHAFMCYYEHIAKLSNIANKQTLFFSHVLSRMEWDSELKQLAVELSPRVRRGIISDLGIESKNPLNLAKGYLKQLTKAGLIKPIGNGTYLIDPESYGYGSYISKELRSKSAAVFQKIIHKKDKEVTFETWVELETGELKQVINGELQK